ncbi:MAG: CusA/CzcA family heavy metal efflux RND transporter [Saprospiraceae bacterium]|nr:MAG: CusA/CzcA family heavy metal efflux RND transporter [Saprospiraceae bacterium]
MINKIIQFSINNKLIIGLFTLALIAWGSYSVTQLPIDAVPDITNNQVQVITLAPSLATQEVEQFITAPIELSIANIPDVIEIRSFSRFGLSVITIVFKDNLDIFMARQRVGERLKEAENNIPNGLGKPEMGPITTGLGEIYHYTLYAKPGYEKKYSPMDLRTMQDWIVKRQLAGTPGVAEVTGWGGYLKQYEVALNNQKLNSMNITVPEIFDALENNNENTGGAYIEKGRNAYFIRGLGLTKALGDIENIVVKNVNGFPILIRNVAKVQYGIATRYGAVSRNGTGEVVGGVVLMLKGANSGEVIKTVKEKIVQIQKSLPEGVALEPTIDRAKLINKAIGTVEKNLLEGGLIVVFILVLFLGNFRAGFLVASVIPLAMLFAISMMNIFGVSGNLMSLGAIDFGLIVDGAVIIVESVVHHITTSKHHGAGMKKLSGEQMDNEVHHAASTMMSSASFGQIIILIVYIPILALIGIEGKMFRPMAQTVSFAILGALILSLTYVPMMSAMFLSRKTEHKRNISDRLMGFFQRAYKPVIEFSLKRKAAVIVGSLVIFLFSLFVFARMGGEFIPTLEEGDLTIEFALPQGTSLTQTVSTLKQMERTVKENFPEVEQAVSHIGTSEIPTDAMSVESGDLMVVLKDKSQWTSADSREELMEKMEEKLAVFADVRFEISQPIQMRFNELMTGIRQDVAVKIYGDDLDVLLSKANEVAKIISTVPGAGPPKVERVAGLSQITVEYDRAKIAQYGLTISSINRTLKTAFAGEVAGVVFEGEKRFDLTVRLDTTGRKDIEDVGDLFIPLPSGSRIPLRQVANVTFREGPAQISRDNTHRRIFVGFNVRGRDVESVVQEIQKKIENQLKLPSGYYVTYGGQFENLIAAKQRLSLAVPAALLLIFILLFFTFKSLKQGMLIFSAIPLSAIGGVFALWLRGMPFSISAGVGFIALFGVAVLNGIVLISTFNQLEKDGIADIKERVLKGTRMRLRPVLMTAAVASFGFLPMAISTSAGAEVQRPLATVVIGGLISATALTLIILPALYLIFSRKRKMKSTTISTAMIAALISCATASQAQPGSRIPLSQAVQTAFQNNLSLQANQLDIERARLLTGSWFDLPKTGVFIENEDFSPEDKSGVWKLGLSQSLESPGVYKARREFLERQLHLTETQVAITQAELKRDVSAAYYLLWYVEEKQQLYLRLDSLYTSLYDAAALRVKTGESAGLEKIAADARLQEIKMQMRQFGKDIAIGQQALMRSLNTTGAYLPEQKPLEKITVSPAVFAASHPLLLRQQQQINLAEADVGLQRKALLPDFSGRVFSQKLYGVSSPVSGFSLSVGVPIAGKSFKKRIEAAQAERTLQQRLLQLETQALQTAAGQARQAVERSEEALRFYETTGLRQASQILDVASLAYRAGEISFAELSQFLTQAIGMRQNYLDALNDYNQSAIQLNYFLNQ